MVSDPPVLARGTSGNCPHVFTRRGTRCALCQAPKPVRTSRRGGGMAARQMIRGRLSLPPEVRAELDADGLERAREARSRSIAHARRGR